MKAVLLAALCATASSLATLKLTTGQHSCKVTMAQQGQLTSDCKLFTTSSTVSIQDQLDALRADMTAVQADIRSLKKTDVVHRRDIDKKAQKGETGAKGSTGATGAKGATGARGATGAKGATGARGSNGSNGAKGQKGETGKAAPTPPPTPATKYDQIKVSAHGSSLPTGYTVTLQLAKHIKSDVRIFYNKNEIDRDFMPAANGRKNAQVRFKLQTGVSAHTTSTAYEMTYLDGLNKTPKQNMHNVYKMYDDFKHGGSEHWSSGYTGHSSSWDTNNGALNQIVKGAPRSAVHALTVYNGPGSDQWRDYTMEFDWYSHNNGQYPGPLIRVKSSSKPQFWWFEYYTGRSGSSMACMRAADGSWDGGWAHQPNYSTFGLKQVRNQYWYRETRVTAIGKKMWHSVVDDGTRYYFINGDSCDGNECNMDRGTVGFTAHTGNAHWKVDNVKVFDAVAKAPTTSYTVNPSRPAPPTPAPTPHLQIIIRANDGLDKGYTIGASLPSSMTATSTYKVFYGDDEIDRDIQGGKVYFALQESIGSGKSSRDYKLQITPGNALKTDKSKVYMMYDDFQNGGSKHWASGYTGHSSSWDISNGALNQIIKGAPRSAVHALTVYNGPGSDQWRDYTMEFDWYSHNNGQYPGPLIRVKSSSKPQFWWFEYYTGRSGSSMACMRAADGSWDGGWAHQPNYSTFGLKQVRNQYWYRNTRVTAIGKKMWHSVVDDGTRYYFINGDSCNGNECNMDRGTVGFTAHTGNAHWKVDNVRVYKAVENNPTVQLVTNL